jgi:nicotinate-nucleotide--dimethylbenzimidazole phosphoribosyltransferase
VTINQLISKIEPLDEHAMELARRRQNVLTKPQGSLGRLESLSIQIAGITGQEFPDLKNKFILLMAGDHGVVEEGVSAYPQDVTAQMVLNIINGGAAVSVLARQFGARVLVVDMGIKVDLPPTEKLIVRKIAHGTGNIARGPAMSREQAEDAILIGAEIIKKEVDNGLNIFATGEMGIGNTTPSAAIAMVLTGKPAGQIIGRGTGISDVGLQKKTAAIRNAIFINKPDPNDGLDILSKIGGFEIAGLTGAILGAAANHIPVIIDGFISTAAAMIAVTIAPQARKFLIAAHKSAEIGHGLMLDWLQLSPLLSLGMRLGEGSGAVLSFSIVEAACRILKEMASFDEAGVSTKSSDE